MTDGPGQQPPQKREVLEGRVIPSRRQAQPPYEPDPLPRPDDPRRDYAAPPSPPGEAQAPAPGPAWAPQQDAPRQRSHRPTAPQAPRRTRQQAPPPPAAQDPAPAPAPAPGRAQSRQRPRRTDPRPPAPPVRPATGASAAGQPPPGPRTPTPDWEALAEQQAASGARRRKVLMLTGGLVAVAVIAGGVATAVVVSGKGSDDPAAAPASSSGSPTARGQSLPPQPSFSSVAPPPPANPLDYLSAAAKDTAPLSAASLFPGRQFLTGGRVYAKTVTAMTGDCVSGARSNLARSLKANGCRELLRATYVQGGVAVTIGVAVFDDTAHASKVQKIAQYVAPLNGGGVRDFCHAVACRMTSNTVGRYAYFAISGLKNGKTITAKDTAAKLAANDASNFAFQRIIQRGRDAAAVDPARG